MKPAFILLATLLLAGCSGREAAPRIVECSIDDALVFVAPNVRWWRVDEYGTIDVATWDGGQLVRRMQENETCADRLQ